MIHQKASRVCKFLESYDRVLRGTPNHYHLFSLFSIIRLCAKINLVSNLRSLRQQPHSFILDWNCRLRHGQ